MKLNATKSLRYGGAPVRAGQTFHAARGHARVLVALGRAEVAAAAPPAPVEAQKPRRIYRRRDAVPSEAAVMTPEPAGGAVPSEVAVMTPEPSAEFRPINEARSNWAAPLRSPPAPAPAAGEGCTSAADDD